MEAVMSTYCNQGYPDQQSYNISESEHHPSSDTLSTHFRSVSRITWCEEYSIVEMFHNQ